MKTRESGVTSETEPNLIRRLPRVTSEQRGDGVVRMTARGLGKRRWSSKSLNKDGTKKAMRVGGVGAAILVVGRRAAASDIDGPSRVGMLIESRQG
jgi:hypothetical protein